MAKFKVSFYRTVTTTDLIEREIEADDAQTARDAAEALAEEFDECVEQPDVHYAVGDTEHGRWTVEMFDDEEA